MYNPFLIFFWIYCLVFLLYNLNFSMLYPHISIDTIVFFVIIFAITLLFAFYVNRYIKIGIISTYNNKKEKNTCKFVVFFILLFNFMEFLYAKQIPLFAKGGYLQYQGIPILHIFIYTFNIFYSINIFDTYIESKNKIYLKYYLILFIPAILIVSRGLIINILLGSLFIYLMKNKNILNLKNIVKLSTIILIVVYLFGVFGNYRSKNDPNLSMYDTSKSNYILNVGEATEFFKNSIIPKEFFWAYLYITSPLANFQKNIDYYKNHNISTNDINTFFFRNIVPDTISKRINYSRDNIKQNMLITSELTVGTMFMESYVDLGWIGVVIIFIYFMLFNLIYIKLLKYKTKEFRIGVAMLCTLSVLGTFSNIMIFTGMSFQLVYPLLTPFFKKYKIRR